MICLQKLPLLFPTTRRLLDFPMSLLNNIYTEKWSTIVAQRKTLPTVHCFSFYKPWKIRCLWNTRGLIISKHFRIFLISFFLFLCKQGSLALFSVMAIFSLAFSRTCAFSQCSKYLRKSSLVLNQRRKILLLWYRVIRTPTYYSSSPFQSHQM